MKSSRFNLVATLIVGAVTVLAPRAQAAVVVFQGDLAGFDALAGSPAIAIDFDSLAPGTNLAGTTIAGVTFGSPPRE